MEDIRFHVQDTMFALLVTYLKTGKRDVINYFSSTWTAADRVVEVDSVRFAIVKRILGQPHEIPGVNIIFHDELPLSKTDRPLYSRLMSVHVYIEASKVPTAEDRTLMKLQRLVDEAMYGGGVKVADLTGAGAYELSSAISWGVFTPAEGWLELTDLATSPYLHRSRNFHLAYADVAIK
jgi:hypothetical protein